MRTIICIFLLVIPFCRLDLNAQNQILIDSVSFGYYNGNSQLFEEYCGKFKKTSLPISICSFNMFNENPTIKDDYKIFIPQELKNQYPNNTFRYLYLLPSNNNNIVALIFQDYLDEYENETLRLYIVSYNTGGDIIDYQELAGYCLDGWDTYLSINKDYLIQRDSNKPLGYLNSEEKTGMRMEQTIYEYIINEDGLFKETKRTTREGYFDFESNKFCPFEQLKE